MRLSALSLEYVKVPVSATVNGTDRDPRSDTVKLAFPLRGVEPQTGDWKTGVWEVDPLGGYLACCLVGPAGTVDLDRGAYDVWVQVSDSPEAPVRKAGRLDIE